MTPTRASVIGSLVGFAMAGCGVGSLLGLWFGTVFLRRLLRDAVIPAAEKELLLQWSQGYTYGTVFTGIFIGFLFGGITGTVYAVYKNRWIDALQALEAAAPDSKPDQPSHAQPTS